MGSTGKKFNLGKKNKKDGTFSVLQDTSIDSDYRGRQRRGLLFVLLYRERERERERERRWRPLDSQFRNWEGSGVCGYCSFYISVNLPSKQLCGFYHFVLFLFLSKILFWLLKLQSFFFLSINFNKFFILLFIFIIIFNSLGIRTKNKNEKKYFFSSLRMNFFFKKV